MAILLEIESTLPATFIDNDPSKDSIERTSIFSPKEMPFLSKYCKKLEDESSTPTQTPTSFSFNEDNNLFPQNQIYPHDLE